VMVPEKLPFPAWKDPFEVEHLESLLRDSAAPVQPRFCIFQTNPARISRQCHATNGVRSDEKQPRLREGLKFHFAVENHQKGHKSHPEKRCAEKSIHGS